MWEIGVLGRDVLNKSNVLVFPFNSTCMPLATISVWRNIIAFAERICTRLLFPLKCTFTMLGEVSFFIDNSFATWWLFFFNVYVFIFEKESMSRWGAEREGERESKAASMLSAQSPALGSISWTMRSQPGLKSRFRCLIDYASQVPLQVRTLMWTISH